MSRVFSCARRASKWNQSLIERDMRRVLVRLTKAHSINALVGTNPNETPTLQATSASSLPSPHHASLEAITAQTRKREIRSVLAFDRHFDRAWMPAGWPAAIHDHSRKEAGDFSLGLGLAQIGLDFARRSLMANPRFRAGIERALAKCSIAKWPARCEN